MACVALGKVAVRLKCIRNLVSVVFGSALGAGAAAVFLFPNAAYAQAANSWIDGNGKWEDGNNWSQLTAPSTADSADTITNDGNNTVTIDANTTNSPSTMTISNLTIRANTLQLTGAIATTFQVLNQLVLGTNATLLITNTPGARLSTGNAVIGGGGSSASNNSVIVAGANSIWTTGSLTVGGGAPSNQLTIVSGGKLLSNLGTISSASNGSNNVAILSDPGSVWSNSGTLDIGGTLNNHLIVSNGATLFTGFLYHNNSGSSRSNFCNLGGLGAASSITITGVYRIGNTIGATLGFLTVTNATVSSGRFDLGGPIGGGSSNNVANVLAGAIWNLNTNRLAALADAATMTIDGGVVTNVGDILWGGTAVIRSGNTLIVTNGGKLFSGAAGTTWDLGNGPSEFNNVAMIAGPGSIWDAGSRTVNIGDLSSSNNTLSVADGGVFSNGALTVGNSATNNVLMIAGGKISVDTLLVTTSNSITFNGGTLDSANTTIQDGANGGAALTVGDGAHPAMFRLLGGVHSFANNLEIRPNAFLIGCGTITGDVLVDAGGNVLADCGTTLNFTSTVTNNGAVVATAGTVLEFYGPVVNTGTIDATGGNVQFLSTVTDNGTILTPTNSWTDGAGKWETGANWSQGIAPTNTQAAILITNAGNKTVTIDATTSGGFPGTMTIQNLNIAGAGSSTNTLALNNAGLATPLWVHSHLTLSNNSAVVINNSALQVDGMLSMGSPIGSGSQLVITNGGKVVSVATAIGGLPGFNNSVVVTGTNSVWINTNTTLSVANSSGGTAIRIADGASFLATNVFLGNSATADGNIVIVTDAGSAWTNTGALFVGGATHHTQFIVSNGATAFSSSATIGNASGTTNSALVTGTNSLWRTDGAIRVGNGGIGDRLTVTDGGSVIASNASHTGLVTVDGATLVLGDGTFKSDNLVVTNNGVVQYALTYHVDNGTITVAGGTVEAGSNLVIATTTDSTGTVLVVGGTLVSTNGAVSVGNDGTSTSGGGVGLLVVSNGTLQTTTILIGSSAGGQGDLIVANGGMITCPAGTNCLMEINSLGTDVYEGGDLEWYNSTLQCGVVAPGDFNVSGGQAPIQDLYIGYSDTGTMTMGAGVVNVTSRLIVGNLGSPLSKGAVWINGGQLTVNSYSIIGNSGVGQMAISNGLVSAADVTVGSSPNPGTLTLAGGTLTVNGIVLPNSSSRFIFTGGWLNCKAITNANGQAATAGNGSMPAMLDLQGGTSTFDKYLTISAIATLSGAGTVSGGVINYGLIAPSGGALTFTGGAVTNYGTIVAPAGGTINFNFNAPVVNYGVIVTNSAVLFNGGFVNNGTFLDAAADSDGDGMNNADEALAGTDPLNGSSVFHIVSIAKEGNDVRVTWSSVGGKRYVVQSSPGNNYSNGFTDFSPTISATAVGESTTNYLDLGAATGTPVRYYRVRLVP